MRQKSFLASYQWWLLRLGTYMHTVGGYRPFAGLGIGLPEQAN